MREDVIHKEKINNKKMFTANDFWKENESQHHQVHIVKFQNKYL